MKLLRGGEEGIQEWNRRIADGEEMPHLKEAFLLNADMQGVDLQGAYLIGASFCQANLQGAILAGTLLSEADFRGADLSDAEFRHANLNGAIFGGTLISCDLSEASGLDSTVHLSRSIVDVRSVLHFRGKLPESFLRGCGLADEEIAHFRKRVCGPILLPSCFICHCSNDEALASRLHRDFQAAGIRCWKWNHEAHICEELVSLANPEISIHDKIVLVVSEHSLMCESVNREIEQIVEEEDRRADLIAQGKAAGRSEILYPIRVDNFIFDQIDGGRPFWEHPLREAVTSRSIADAVGWDTTREKYDRVRDQLIHALKSACAP